MAACSAALYAMSNRHSGLSRGVWLSWMSRPTTAKRSLISLREVSRTRIQRLRKYSLKVTLFPQDEDSLSPDDGFQEVPACLGLRLSGRVDGRDHLASKVPFHLAQGPDDLGQGNVTDDQDVEIAGFRCLSPSDGPVDEGQIDGRGQREQRGPQPTRGAHGLGDECPQVLEDGTGPVGLEVDVATLLLAREDSATLQPGQLPLNVSVAESDPLDDLTHVERPVHVPVEQVEDLSARRREEGLPDRIEAP